MSLTIDGDLNLVLPVGELKVYHTPISRQVFEANYKALAVTRVELAGHGLDFQMDAGPRIAALTLMDELRKSGDEEKGKAFMTELSRLSMILIPAEQGWEMKPVSVAISSGKLDAEEWREVESAIVFFTAHYSMAKKSERVKMMDAVASLLMGSSTSLACSDFVASLPKPTTDGTIAAQVVSSVPH